MAGSLASSINQTELGTYLGYGFFVWTGSQTNGTVDGTNTCSGWTVGVSGSVGRSSGLCDYQVDLLSGGLT